MYFCHVFYFKSSLTISTFDLNSVFSHFKLIIYMIGFSSDILLFFFMCLMSCSFFTAFFELSDYFPVLHFNVFNDFFPWYFKGFFSS